MEKEKQAYYQLKELYAGRPTWSALAEMADNGNLLDIVADFIEEHEKEISDLKAEKTQSVIEELESIQDEWSSGIDTMENMVERRIYALKQSMKEE
jgi:hypothetical protein